MVGREGHGPAWAGNQPSGNSGQKWNKTQNSAGDRTPDLARPSSTYYSIPRPVPTPWTCRHVEKEGPTIYGCRHYSLGRVGRIGACGKVTKFTESDTNISTGDIGQAP